MEKTKISAVGLGEKLKKAREGKNLSLEQVQAQTHIHYTVLRALEEGRGDEILTSTYIKSFLRKYAQFLGLDSRELNKEYESYYSENLPKERKEPQVVMDNESKKTATMLKAIFNVSIVIACLLAAVLTFSILKKVFASIKTAKPAKTVSQSTRPKSAAQPVKPAIVRKTESAPKKNEPFNIAIKIKSPVKVKVEKDGDVLFDRVLPKGLSESFYCEEKMVIQVAKGEAVELVLNGKSLGSPGNGPLKNIEITSNGIKKR